MKKSTKIILVITILLSVASAFFARFVFWGIVPNGQGFSFNFSTLGYVGLSLMVLSSIFSGILFFRFLKMQKLSGAIFFSLAPLSLTYGAFIVYITAIQQLNDTTSLSVKATLNMVGEKNINGFLWVGVATLIYLVALFLLLLLLCRPLSKVQKIAQKLGDGRMKYDDYKIGGGKQFMEIEHSFNKINYNYRAKENKIRKNEIEKDRLSKEMVLFLGKNGFFELECGNQIRKNACVMSLKFSGGLNNKIEKNFAEKNPNYVADYLRAINVVLKKYGAFVERTVKCGAIIVFPNAKCAVECSNNILRTVEAKNKSEKFLQGMECHIALNYGSLVFGVEEGEHVPKIVSGDFDLYEKMQDVNQKFQTRIVFTKDVLNTIDQNYTFDFRFLTDIDGIAIYEDLMCYRAIMKNKLKKCKNQFESAVQAFQKGEYRISREEFSKILKYVPLDKTTFTYFNLSAEKSIDVA